jgi:hypothetical protein
MKNRVLYVFLFFISANFVLAQDTRKASAQGQQQIPPSVSVTPATLDFGEQVIKRPSKPLRLTITNTGEKKLYINSVVINGNDQQDFVMNNDTCTGKEIDAKKSCVVDIVFTPSANERRSSAAVLTDNASDSPQKIGLTGVGINSVAVPPSKGRPRK